MAALSKARTVFDHSGSNPARGMDVCPRSSALCCPVWVGALRRDESPLKEFYQMSIDS